jgi:glyoxylase-like metal-dependent hydrolase (beta-lactamase superfamily II)
MISNSKSPQHVAGPVWLLRQHGADTAGPAGQPPNAYAIKLEGRTILFDAPFSWCMADLEDLEAEGHTPDSLVLSGGGVVAHGDAFEEVGRRKLRVYLHPADRGPEAARKLRGDFRPLGDLRLFEGAHLLNMPGHTAGSIALYLPIEGGIVLAGGCAVADADGMLRRPAMGRGAYLSFAQSWMILARTNKVSAVLPLWGPPLLRSEHGAEFDRMFANLWEGEPAAAPERAA